MKKQLLVLTVAAVLLLGSLTFARTAPDSASHVIEILVEHRVSGKTDGQSARAALVELGPSAIPAFCSILSGGTTGSDHGARARSACGTPTTGTSS